MREKVRRAPQELHARALHVAGQLVDHGVEHAVGFGRRGAFGSHIAVVETVEGRTQMAEEIESRRGLGLGIGESIATAVPGPTERSRPEHVLAVRGKRMPVAHGHAQMIFHTLAADHAILVVVAVGQRRRGVRASVTNGFDS